jgi:hypothetical protein
MCCTYYIIINFLSIVTLQVGTTNQRILLNFVLVICIKRIPSPLPRKEKCICRYMLPQLLKGRHNVGIMLYHLQTNAYLHCIELI